MWLLFSLHSSLPELSSLTSDDIVLVMESAAMSRSFLRFLLGPFGVKQTNKNSLKWDPVQLPITRTQTAVVSLCYPERRPPERPRPRPWVSPEVCESGSCRQNPSGLVWELAGWWCGWVKSAASRDPESKGCTHLVFCVRRKPERLPCSIRQHAATNRIIFLKTTSSICREQTTRCWINIYQSFK